LAVTGETTGRQCWEVHKDTVTCIIEKHIKDPALVKRLVDAWDSAVDLGVTTAKALPAQKKKKTDRAIRLTSVRQATSVLLSQIGLIACKWCVYCGLHDCCLTTKKQFGQLGDSEQCCALSTQFTHPLTHTHTHNTQEYKPGDTKYSAKPVRIISLVRIISRTRLHAFHTPTHTQTHTTHRNTSPATPSTLQNRPICASRRREISHPNR
jgi:hypothetical protein